MGAQTTNQSSFVYKRREPEKTLLYSALVSGIEPWLAERKNDTSKTQFPDFVEQLTGLVCMQTVTSEKESVQS
jgi:hypothetical protein